MRFTGIAAALALLASAAAAQSQLDRSGALPSPGPIRDAPTERPRIACGRLAMAFAGELLDVRMTNQELAGMAAAPDGATTFADLARLARRKGLHARAFRMTPAQLARLQRVAILQLVVRSGPDQDWREHFVTWAGPGPTEGTGIVFDPIPARGRGEVPMKTLAAQWTGAALVISDEPVDPREITGEAPLWSGLLRSGAVGAVAGSLACAAIAYLRSRRPHHATA